MSLARVAEWQTRRTQNPLSERVCGFNSHLGHQVIHTLSPMGQRLLQRKLHQTSSRLRELREELRIVEDQLSQLAADADEKALRALVAETPVTAFEHRDAQKHADAMQRHHDKVKASIIELEQKMDELLDRLNTGTS